MSAPCLVLGLGNELFTDEGVGIEAARRIDALGLPGVEVVDGGTLGIGLLPAVEDRAGLLVLDAVVAEGRRPGEVVTLDAPALRQGYRVLMSAHQIGLPEVLAAAELGGHPPARVAAVGMVPADLDTGFGISPAAAAQVGEMIARALDVLARWGVGADA